ncbi:MAG TPA: septal ring lytic transglycosylase RlpA family protein [Casimicrobiaceae bacterium]
MHRFRYASALVVLALAACSSTPPRPAGGGAGGARSSGQYYLDDGPPLNIPANLASIPDAVPRLEPLKQSANKPYYVLGREYVPATRLEPYHERGVASWYGRRYNGQRTSTGEVYDMFAMTAAHPTLPLPSYARVTDVATGRSVVVRVNDRGPFLRGRIIDLSYAAAYKLGVAQKGSDLVDVDAILPGDTAHPLEATAPAPLAPVLAPAPPAAPVTVATAGVAPVTETRGGYAVQLGAFANFSNAENFLARVQNQLAQVAVEPRIRQGGGLYHVYVGPYPGRDEARRVGERITQAFGYPVMVAPN